jgi:hypothetical protein
MTTGKRPIWNVLLFASLTTLSCRVDMTGPDVECAGASLQLAGLWRGELDGAELTLQLRDECEAPLGFIFGPPTTEPPSWHVRGNWTRGALNGHVSGAAATDPPGGFLELMPEWDPPVWPTRTVILTIPADQLPPQNSISVTATGAWSTADTADVIASFDTVQFVLLRQQ